MSVVDNPQRTHRRSCGITAYADPWRMIAIFPVQDMCSGEGYRRMLAQLPMGRAATPDEVGELLLTHRGAFITGSDFLMDGGVTAAY